jgi:ABC-type bacteriocin/lantibiotic exporter with double-glycine peptidase domain
VTRVIIAHRPETINSADRVIDLDALRARRRKEVLREWVEDSKETGDAVPIEKARGVRP